MKQSSAAPKPIVRPIDAIALVVGIVIGAGIFRTPSIVAGNAASASAVYVAWLLGGLISLVGALVYAELSTTYPNAGGDYYYLQRAFGHHVAFLFGWSRMTVIQTGSLATVVFIFGDYASQIFSLGEYSSAIYAAFAITILTGINVIGVREGTGVQNLLTAIQVCGMIFVIGAAFLLSSSQPPAPHIANSSSSFGLMLLFVLFTYGGWNEAAYVSGELREIERNMAPVLVTSIALITVLYTTINWAYLHVLSLNGVAASQQVAADLMQSVLGSIGAKVVSGLVAISALTTANATVFTGGRSSYALGCDYRQFRFLGRWSEKTGTPVNGLLLQAVIALGLIVLGVLAHQGFQAIVEYTAPVFWSFFLLSGVALIMLRYKDRFVARPFRVPLYPASPILFCMTCAYLLYSSLAYTGIGALAGVVVLIVGALLLLVVTPK